MADTVKLMKQSILQLAMRGELVKPRKDEKHFNEINTTVLIEDIPYEIPNTWKWLELIDVVDNYDAQRKPVSVKKRESMSGSYPYYGASGIIDSINGWTHEGKFVLIGEDGANLLTRSTPLAFIAEGKIWVNNHAHVLKSKEIIIDEFLVHYINSISVAPYVTGSAQPKLSQRNLNKIKVPVPPFEEQQRIVQKIEESFSLIDKLADKRKNALQTIRLIRETTLQRAVQGKLVEQSEQDEPASELITRIEEEKDKLIKEKKIKKEKKLPDVSDEEKNFDIPDNWEWVRLGNILNTIMGQSPKGNTVSEDNNGIEFHQGKTNFGKKYLLKSEVKTIEPKKVVQKDTVLLSVRAPVGDLNISNREIAIGRGLCGIIPYVEMESDYIYYTLSALEQDMKDKSTGTTFKAISGKIIKNLVLPLPPIEEQNRIIEKIEQIMKICDQMEELFK